MFLTSEGALLALALAGLVTGLLGAWMLLRPGARKPETPPREIARPGQVRRQVMPVERSPRV